MVVQKHLLALRLSTVKTIEIACLVGLGTKLSHHVLVVMESILTYVMGKF